MVVECEHCYTKIEEGDSLIEYDQLPYHTECMKEMFREDNPNLSEEDYEEFDQKAEIADKFERSGNVLIPIIHEKAEKRKKSGEDKSQNTTEGENQE